MKKGQSYSILEEKLISFIEQLELKWDSDITLYVIDLAKNKIGYSDKTTNLTIKYAISSHLPK